MSLSWSRPTCDGIDPSASTRGDEFARGGENCGKENGKRDKMGISCSISACTDVVTQYRSYLQGAGLRPSADGSAVRTSLVAGDG